MSNQEPSQTTDAVAHREELVRMRAKRVESLDFMTSWEEAERRKKEAFPTETQDDKRLRDGHNGRYRNQHP